MLARVVHPSPHLLQSDCASMPDKASVDIDTDLGNTYIIYKSKTPPTPRGGFLQAIGLSSPVVESFAILKIIFAFFLEALGARCGWVVGVGFESFVGYGVDGVCCVDGEQVFFPADDLCSV